MIYFYFIAGAILLLSAVILYCAAPGRIPPEAEKMAKKFCGLNCAHRGLHTENQKIPENSLPAFAAAREKGYGVELDVQLSKDGQVVVFHDDDLKRACGLDIPVNSLDWKELSALPLFGTHEHIPLLTETLKTLGNAPAIVELKSTGANNTELCEKTLDILRLHGRYWCVESFDPYIVGWFRKNAPDVLRGQLSQPPEKYDSLSKFSAFMLGNLLANFVSRPHFVAYSNGKRPVIAQICLIMKPLKAVWTVRPDNDIAKCESENEIIIFE